MLNINSFSISIREQNELFKKLLRPLALLLILMTVQRWLFEMVANLEARFAIDSSDYLQIYLMGFRFDLLIIAFILGPLFFLIPFKFSFKIKITKIYLSLMWVLVSVLNFINIPYFSINQRFINQPDWEKLNIKQIFEIWFTGQEVSIKFLFFIFTFLILSRGILAIVKINAMKNTSTSGIKLELLKLIIFLIAVIFCARGKLGSHHLRREDSYIVLNPSWNELSLNPQWSFNKDDR